jgi:hypothetical protein
MAARSSVVFPLPFGPIRIVGDPGAIVSVMEFSIATSRRKTEAFARTRGRSEAGARMLILRSVRRRGACPRPAR